MTGVTDPPLNPSQVQKVTSVSVVHGDGNLRLTSSMSQTKVSESFDRPVRLDGVVICSLCLFIKK